MMPSVVPMKPNEEDPVANAKQLDIQEADITKPANIEENPDVIEKKEDTIDKIIQIPQTIDNITDKIDEKIKQLDKPPEVLTDEKQPELSPKQIEALKQKLSKALINLQSNATTEPHRKRGPNRIPSKKALRKRHRH